ncbi:MAG: EI24 domain-containing protein [Alphaproteobacteria bacterium]
MLNDIAKSFDQLFTGKFWSVTLKSILLTLPLLGVAIWLGFTLVDTIPATRYDWLNSVIDFVGSLGAIVLSLILFPALAQMVMGLFLDDIAAAVEQKHYARDPAGNPVGMGTAVGQGVKLGVLIIVVNLVLLPLYLIFLFFPLLSLALYYLVNGWLLNREYFELVATRHGDAKQHKAWRRGNGGRLFLAGCAIAFVFTIPVVNLVAPAWATAFMTHVFKRVEGESHAVVP